MNQPPHRMARPPADPSAIAWLDAAGRVPLLTPAEELHLGALVRAWQDHPAGPADAPAGIRRRGIRARNRIVSANLRFVAHVVERCRGNAPIADRLQVGTLGLIRAAEKYDPARGYRLTTYAYMWIRQALNIGEVKEKTIHIPSNVYATICGVKDGKVSAESVTAAMAVTHLRSLDAPVLHGDEATALSDLLPAATATLEEVAHAEACQRALEAMRQIDADGCALLELAGEGNRIGQLAEVEGASTATTRNRLIELRQRLRAVPEVEQVINEAWAA